MHLSGWMETYPKHLRLSDKEGKRFESKAIRSRHFVTTPGRRNGSLHGGQNSNTTPTQPESNERTFRHHSPQHANQHTRAEFGCQHPEHRADQSGPANLHAGDYRQSNSITDQRLAQSYNTAAQPDPNRNRARSNQPARDSGEPKPDPNWNRFRGMH